MTLYACPGPLFPLKLADTLRITRLGWPQCLSCRIAKAESRREMHSHCYCNVAISHCSG